MNCINHPDRPRIAFCQNCGKPLCSECARVVGSAVFDEPCLAERLAAAQSPAGSGQTPGSYVAPPPIAPPGAPNPVLAAVLGFIPGVGAMYNGQYAKGVVHLIVFAVLVSLSDRNGIFGLFVAGWVFYQVFEAYHTAKARRDGTPLPNPFGLNDLGERLGFGKAWAASHPLYPASASAAAATNPSAPDADTHTRSENPYAASAAASAGAPYTPYAAYPPPPTANSGWGAPTDYPGYAPVAPGAPPPLEVRPNRFPVGAVILIALGVLFLIGNAGWVETFPIYRLFPFLLLGLGVWLFARRMLETGTGFADDGTPQYKLRLLRALRGSIWIFVVGLLAFLDSFHILSWGRSWPIFIVAAGVMGFLQRSAFLSAASPTGGGYPVPPVVPTPAPNPPSSTSVVPREPISRSEEEV